MKVKSSALRVLPIEILKTKVYTRKNIQRVEENIGKENEFIGWEYDEEETEKDEYIAYISNLQEELTQSKARITDVESVAIMLMSM